jgi:hypothetical protein
MKEKELSQDDFYQKRSKSSGSSSYKSSKSDSNSSSDSSDDDSEMSAKVEVKKNDTPSADHSMMQTTNA